jgi:hypothetical protein
VRRKKRREGKGRRKRWYVQGRMSQDDWYFHFDFISGTEPSGF